MKILLAVAAAVALLAPAASAGTTTLTGTVGPGFTITLKKGSTKVAKLKSGTYKLVIKDVSPDHNFHLTGRGVNKSTNVDTTGTVTWTVKLKKGKYTYVCDPHASSMRGSFRVR